MTAIPITEEHYRQTTDINWIFNRNLSQQISETTYIYQPEMMLY